MVHSLNKLPVLPGSRRTLQSEVGSAVLLPAVLLPAAGFQQVLARERLRTDRNSLSFTVLVLSPHANRAAAFAEIAAVLAERLRETDVAGYLDDERVAVLLPDTDCDGAATLADAVRVKLTHGQCLDHEVFVYPGSTKPTHQPRAPRSTRPTVAATHAHTLAPLFAQPLPFWKRVADLIASASALVILAPLLILIAVLIKLTSRGPVLFKQWRSGLGGVPFLILKFRTMCVGAEDRQAGLRAQNEQDGPAFKMQNDPRVTPLGSYLRKSCLDELPQLWNVLKGDMTLVGPRPLPCQETEQCRPWQRRRLDVMPGLTCFWQVSGSRLDFAEWMRSDIRYIAARRLWLDVRLLAITVVKVVLHRASY